MFFGVSSRRWATHEVCGVGGEQSAMYDVAIKSGFLVDGSGRKGTYADVGVRDGIIVAVGHLDEEAVREIDAEGLIVAPGFIDPHTHYDAAAFWDPDLTPSPLFGVTTVLGGNCGFTVAPLTDGVSAYVCAMLAAVEGIPTEALATGFNPEARSFLTYLSSLDGKLTINAGFSVGHSTVRRIVMGPRAVGERANAAEIAKMEQLIHRSLDEGALGFTTSLGSAHTDAGGDPVPSRFASEEELRRLAATVRPHPGTSLGITPPSGAFSAEITSLFTEMSLAGDRPLNWNVLQISADDQEVVESQLAASDSADRAGASVIALTVPELSKLRLSFENGMILNMVPGWAEIFALPHNERLRQLARTDVRSRMRLGLDQIELSSLRTRLELANLTIGETYAPENAGSAGKKLGVLAKERLSDPLDALLDVVIADDLRTDIWPSVLGDDDESWELRRRAWLDGRVVMGGGDAGAHLDMTQSWRYFTTLLGTQVRSRGLLPLETAIHLLTDRPARLFGLKGRGRVSVGARADLVLFDLRRVGATEPVMRPDLPGGASRLWSQGIGIEHVLVNGITVVHKDRLTGSRGGQILRSGRDTDTVRPRDFRAHAAAVKGL
jgi:N-acyl-D-aspartate/D-glutamate deacylase